MFYPACIHSDSDGSASGFFPDVRWFPGRRFQEARDALIPHFEALFEMDDALPLAGNVEA